MLFGVFPDIRRLENLMRAELQREALTVQIIAETKREAADRLRSITPDPAEGRRRWYPVLKLNKKIMPSK